LKVYIDDAKNQLAYSAMRQVTLHALCRKSCFVFEPKISELQTGIKDIKGVIWLDEYNK
jgi:hypothetical protein